MSDDAVHCFYCDRIASTFAGYERRPAARDLGSPAPRCERHWRYVCVACGEPAHFMASAFCRARGAVFCASCAREREERDEPFWGWAYAVRLRSPWSGEWCWTLERAEFEGAHPIDAPAHADRVRAQISAERFLRRYPEAVVQWWADDAPDADERVRDNWNRNADVWAATYDEDGDFTRRHLSDPVLLDVLGDVDGLDVLDAGAGNGYLCRKLARRGARVVGVELSDRFVEIARAHPDSRSLDVTYHASSISSMPFLPDASFDRVVSNFVLQDVLHLEEAVDEMRRVLRPGGAFVSTIFHPCFGAGPAGWNLPAADSPRPEERTAYRVNDYFRRGAMYSVWGELRPVLGFHRTLADLWKIFTRRGFTVTRLEEPELSEESRRSLPPSRRLSSARIAYALVLRLERTT